MTEVNKFTKKELRSLNWRWIWHSQIGWNYERMQGLGYLTTMLPAIDKLYGDNPEMKKKALETHSVFFNTTPQMGDIIVGMDLAIEEQDPTESGLAVAASIKTALMGPFAGIGDTIFGVITGAVFGSIAASMR
jgi:Phosphotransferase system, mannose/fructose/N-acetylgalactosamine-specific component IID